MRIDMQPTVNVGHTITQHRTFSQRGLATIVSSPDLETSQCVGRYFSAFEGDESPITNVKLTLMVIG